MKARRRIALAIAALTATAACGLAALALGAGHPDGSHAGGSARDEAAQLLRLTDLPLGYLTVELQEDRGHVAECEPLTDPEDTPARMLKFVRRFHPQGCIFGFQQLYGEPGPFGIGTGVLDARSKAEADAAWAVVPEMLGRLLRDHPPRPGPAPEKIGSATRLFHSSARIYYGHGRRAPITFLVWRTGNTLAAVVAEGRSREVDDATAVVLAKLQQARIAKPTPLRQADNYDAEVPLENPAVDLPVYWLGRDFHPPGGLPELRLGDSWFAEKPAPEREEEGGFAEGPLPKLRLSYYSPNNVTFSTWGPEDWSTYADSKTGKAIVTWKCTKTKQVPVAGGTATIYLGYAKNLAKCPKKPPHAFTAWVRYGEDTVVVNEPFAADSIETVNPYGSFAGVETLLAGLHLRTRPTP
jgi:hypothetical protein